MEEELFLWSKNKGTGFLMQQLNSSLQNLSCFNFISKSNRALHELYTLSITFQYQDISIKQNAP